MTTSAKFQLLCAALLTLGPLAASPMERSSKPYVVLDKTLSQLRADFNANVGKVRMLYIVGPTCGICLRGLSDLQEALYSKKGDDPRLVTFVVHVPTLGARENSVAEATQLISNRYTTNYWEETGIVGRLIQQSMGFSKYTWDYWTIYDPSTYGRTIECLLRRFGSTNWTACRGITNWTPQRSPPRSTRCWPTWLQRRRVAKIRSTRLLARNNPRGASQSDHV